MPDWIIEIYRDTRGHLPVLDDLNALSPSDQARIVRTIDLLKEYGPRLKMPHVRHLGSKLWELRVDGRPNSYRVLYAGVPGRRFLLLHLFAKKSDKTPARELATAQRRLADYLERQA